MTTPSLTLARRLYAQKHGVRVAGVHAQCQCRPDYAGPWRADVWHASGFAAAGGPTESAALRKLCRALGWKP